MTSLGTLVIATSIAAFAAGLLVGRGGNPDDGYRLGIAEAVHEPEICIASWYETGELTATGEPFDPRALAAASTTLPLGTRVVVTDLAGGRSVVVHVNDRGPYVRGRCIDLTLGAFSLLTTPEVGLLPVLIEPLPGHGVSTLPRAREDP